ncbi:hypothetical protein [Spiroplasma sp. DGKH1]|uniref:hypothetical protein n=1 Tax=Spiroplasma sp. DGKH1 TaxID=3050074 RepID=UPI0034C67C7B
MPINQKDLQAAYMDFRHELTLKWALDFDLKNLQYYEINPDVQSFYTTRNAIIKKDINKYLSKCYEAFIKENTPPDFDGQLENPFENLKETVINNITNKINEKSEGKTILAEREYIENQLIWLMDKSISQIEKQLRKIYENENYEAKGKDNLEVAREAIKRKINRIYLEYYAGFDSEEFAIATKKFLMDKQRKYNHVETIAEVLQKVAADNLLDFKYASLEEYGIMRKSIKALEQKELNKLDKEIKKMAEKIENSILINKNDKWNRKTKNDVIDVQKKEEYNQKLKNIKHKLTLDIQRFYRDVERKLKQFENKKHSLFSVENILGPLYESKTYLRLYNNSSYTMNDKNREKVLNIKAKKIGIIKKLKGLANNKPSNKNSEPSRGE